jgi:hypothetical protein
MPLSKKQSDHSNIIHSVRRVVSTEREKDFHKQKAVDALERMKKAVDKEDLKDANRQEDVFDHHLQ